MNVGIEYEFLLVDKDFNPSNNSVNIVNYCNENGLPLHLDCSKSIIEFSGTPGNIVEVFDELCEFTEKLDILLNDSGYDFLPIDNPFNFNFKSEILDKQNYNLKKNMLGEEVYYLSGSIMAVHLHFDEREEDYSNLRLYNFLNIFDSLGVVFSPVVGKAKKSDFKFSDNFEILNLRSFIYRKILYNNFPNQGDLQGVFSDYIFLENFLQKSFNDFREVSLVYGDDYVKYGDKYSSVWGPVRFNKKFKTIEYRGFGSNPDLYLIFGLISLASASIRKIERLNLSNEYIFENFLGTDNTDVASEKIKYLSNSAMLEGLSSDDVFDLAVNVFDFCSSDMSSQELFFADYLKKNYLLKRTSISKNLLYSDMSQKEKALYVKNVFKSIKKDWNKNKILIS
ncbi:hypothetical protein K9L97_00205 [Candidatus Woesearchaeota archaeon]|nr:hypothetical protein [Candidatus Woesearchaeota archaeon]